MQFIAFGILLAVLLHISLKAYFRLNEKRQAAIKYVLGVVMLAFIGLVMLRFSPIISAIIWFGGLLIPALKPLWEEKPSLNYKEGQFSHITTDFLTLTFDHATGKLEAQFHKGPLAGKSLFELSQDEVLAAYHEIARQSPDSAELFAAWLDHEWGIKLRESSSEIPPSPASSATMTTDEACTLLGVPPSASIKEIRAAHRRLMRKLHPDKGGSSWLAQKINQARDMLLRIKNEK